MEIEVPEAAVPTEGTPAPEAAPEIETGAEAPVETTEDADPLAELLKEVAGPDEGAPEAETEVEYEGKTYKVPPELKDALLRQSDYTKKTMSLADERRAIEAEAKQLAEVQAITKEELGAAVQYQLVQEKMQALLETNVEGLSEDQITRLRLDLNDLEKQASHWANAAQEAGQKRQTQASLQLQQAREAAFTEAAKRIPNFTPERRQALEQFALSHGAAQDVVANLADPTVYEILHLADIGKRFIDSQKKTKQVKEAIAIQPASEVGGKKATAQKNPETMTPEEYHKYRMKQRTGG